MNKAREIKFRAWDSFKKEMVYCDGNHYWAFFDDPISIGYGLYHRNDNHRILSGEYNPPIMQFTGLQVKGIYLYESDILRSPHYKNQRGKQEYLYHVVKWNTEHHCWQTVSIGNEEGESISVHGNPPLWIYFKNEGAAEIIGNIFEHPHLLPNDIQNNGASQGTMPIEQNDDKQNNL